MNRARVLLVAIAASLSLGAAALAQPAPAQAPVLAPTPARPPGVAAAQWIALSPAAGVALAAPGSGEAPLLGTLYALSGGVWRPVYLETPRRGQSTVPASRYHGARGPMFH